MRATRVVRRSGQARERVCCACGAVCGCWQTRHAPPRGREGDARCSIGRGRRIAPRLACQGMGGTTPRPPRARPSQPCRAGQTSYTTDCGEFQAPAPALPTWRISTAGLPIAPRSLSPRAGAGVRTGAGVRLRGATVREGAHARACACARARARRRESTRIECARARARGHVSACAREMRAERERARENCSSLARSHTLSLALAVSHSLTRSLSLSVSLTHMHTYIYSQTRTCIRI